MKSNQERSNECLPPKKREILALEEKAVVVASASESQRGENLAWLASVASGQSSGQHISSDNNNPPHKPLSSTAEYPSSSSSSSSSLPRVAMSGSALTPLPAVYSSPLSQPAGTIQYTQLPPNVQFISPAYGGPYTGYISSQLISPTATSAPTPAQRPRLEAYGAAVVSPAPKGDQRHLLGTPPPPPSAHPAGQYVQMAGSPLSVTAGTVSSPGTHLPLHPTVLPHTLTLAPSQVVVQYTDGLATKKEEGRTRELLNGEVDKGRRYGLLLEANLVKQSGAAKVGSGQPQQHYEARHVVIPADYAQETSGLQTSLMLVPNSHANSSGMETDTGLDKPPSSTAHGERAGLGLDKPVPNRASSFTFPSSSSSSSETLKTPVTTLSPHTVIQTTPSATEQISMGVPAASFYPASQPPIIGYIASGGQQQQQTVSYHATLPQHLLIPSGQPLLIPVSGGGGGGEQEPPHPMATAPQQLATAAPHAYVATPLPKCELVGVGEQQASSPFPAAPIAPGNLVQAQLQLPAPAAPTPAPSLPPYFMKGSIIQLADGELKRVEDLRTEDFIQSAEISGELKIDSSTVERIDGSPAPNSAIIQFAVGEHRVQVSVEVLVEYPFFVFGQGWSSCCPDRTTQLFELSCAKLSVGDVCISLTLKNLKNGSLRKSQSQAPGIGASPALLLKPPKTEGSHRDRGGHHREQENGIGQWVGGAGGGAGGPVSENGELKSGEKTRLVLPPKTESGGADRPAGRKRRWSAPEGRQAEKSDEGPSPTLPKTTFISQEVKICIEGRSNIGK
ncbi:ataxin-1-like [Megalops cyprinoides]|uniref:ataxin-1-like n=1 Tax=Megalops cyprinoides TaxID=118141 RepID=UPI001864DA93|nr:ataxin-1-like [Megalops cyprinoides]XP_036395198.1 ataxin-1-like [Megalops cyprinoides]XP_036395199.1 ataxin-1-like [Megalops cyprinoides]